MRIEVLDRRSSKVILKHLEWPMTFSRTRAKRKLEVQLKSSLYFKVAQISGWCLRKRFESVIWCYDFEVKHKDWQRRPAHILRRLKCVWTFFIAETLLLQSVVHVAWFISLSPSFLSSLSIEIFCDHSVTWCQPGHKTPRHLFWA